MLRVTLIGNIGADPEVRYTATGTQQASFRVAVNQHRNGPDGEKIENTEWFRIRAGGRLSQFAARLTRGNRVLVVGRLDISHYQSKDGEAKTGFDVWADEIQGLSAREGGGSGDAGSRDNIRDVDDVDVGDEARPAPARSQASPNGGSGTQQQQRRPAGRAGDLEDLPF